jgi:predicted metal-dependent phosphoesterase TrpH
MKTDETARRVRRHEEMKNGLGPGARWRKAELHSHCSADPDDYRICNYTPEQLIAEAGRLGYEILAITCHDLDVWSHELSEFAESQGVLLIPGMEVTAEGRFHVLAYNFQTGCENLNSLEKMRARKKTDTLLIAPHAFYPARTCLRHLVEPNIDLFDALEISGFHTRLFDFNGRARNVAEKHQKPLVGNADVHRLWQLGRTWTWIYSEPGVVPALTAVKQGQVCIESNALSMREVIGWWGGALWHCVFPANRRPDSRTLTPIYDRGVGVGD